MEDQGKRLLLAVGIAFGLMLLWNVFFPPAKSKPKPAGDEAGEVATAGRDAGPDEATGPGGTGKPSEGAETEASPEPPADRGEERLIEFDFPTFTATMSSYGGTLASWKLKGERFVDHTKEGDPPLELVRTGDDEHWRPFEVWFADSTYGVTESAEWTVSNQTDTTIDFTWESSALRVVKHFQFLPEDYLLQMSIEVTKLARGDAKQSLAISTFGFQEPGKGGSSFGGRVSQAWEAICYTAGDDVRQASVKELAKSGRGDSGDVRFAGFSHSYFLAAMSPKNENEERLSCLAAALPTRDGAMEMTLIFPEITLRDGDPPYTRLVTGYFGPKYLDRLQAADDIVGYTTAFDESVNFGMLAILCRPLLWLLKTFQGVVVNWGIAIILLTLVVQAITLPWTTKSMRSMKAMAKLRPQMEKIKEKFPNDKQRQQVEIMNLYKAHKVNPLAGCLPMVLQMPIWFALYRSLGLAAELYQAPFIPGWLGDLTAPDPYYVMPVLLMGMMFLQTKLQPNPVESTQQKIMMYGMPIMFGGFSLFFPSGLTLYILTNTILRTSHQVYLNKQDAAGGDDKSDKDDKSDAKTSAAKASAAAEPAGDDDDAAGAKPGSNGTGERRRSSSKPKKKGKRKKTGGRAAN